MNIKEIKEMISLMNENGLLELEIEKDGMRVKLKKAGHESDSFAAPLIIERGKPLGPASKQTIEAPDAAAIKTIEIKAPMVGTFYRAPSPEAPSYVEIGQILEAGQVICIIEAMKLMNEIKSELKGEILEILVDNTEPVEFGQPLFLIKLL
ncbi:MAG: acetyl-CoA carboxylase biotin carboxyl carrier protein [Candidatus Omnitrophota bacterium]|nr:acetyl-CoA carboxylase biotin carboxyl carrier protein [Candidatus Omnitrophota bacterium]